MYGYHTHRTRVNQFPQWLDAARPPVTASSPIRAVEGAVRDGFAQVLRLDGWRSINIGNRALYAKLGFVVREPLGCMQGPAIRKSMPGHRVRAAEARDFGARNDLCLRVHGHDRRGEVRDAVQHRTAVVAESQGRIVAYASSIAFFDHAVGERNAGLSRW